ncbi:MAG: hypothetical protein J6Q22_08285 [Prevotella sp.]|nr:hypothetical protein [Prevotella sp.]
MELADLKHFNTLDMLKYLAYLQVCQENSSHLQILQELQNRVLKGEDIMAQPTNPVGVCKSLTQKHVAKRYMIAEKLLPLHHESYQQYKYV